MALLDRPLDIKNFVSKPWSPTPPRKRLVVVQPRYYRIAYAINPHMTDKNGKLNEVDSRAAESQWRTLVKTFGACGLEVEVLDGRPEFPDMVFAANQSFPYWNFKTNKPEVLLANMTNEERRGEVGIFAEWFRSQDYRVQRLPEEFHFEGTGDAILDPVRPLIWCGYGYRTSREALSRICETTGLALVPLELKSESFYHLDTCFAPLTEHTAVIVKEAFSSDGLERLRAGFEELIECEPGDAKNFLGANLFCPNSRDVILDEGNAQLIEELHVRGMRVHPVATSEFLKSGGSVFCMKLHLW